MKFSWLSVLKFSLSRIIPGFINFAVLPIYSFWFSPAEFGYYSIVMATVTLLMAFSSVQLRTIIMRFYAKYRQEGKEEFFFTNIMFAQTIFMIVISFFLVILKIYSPVFIPNKYLVYAYIVIFLFITSSLFDSLISFFRANNESKRFSLFWVMYSIGRHGLAILFCYFYDKDIAVLFIGFIISGVIIDFILVYIFIKKYSFKISSIDKKFIIDKYRFVSPLMFSSIVFWVINYLDRFLIEWMRDSKEVGLYSMGFIISERLMRLITSSLMLHAYPILSNSYEKECEKKTVNLLNQVSQNYLLIAVPIFLVIFIFSKDIVESFLDKAYNESSSVLPLIAFSMLILGLTEYVTKGFELKKKTKYILYSALIAGIISVSLNLIIIDNFGYLGAGIVSVISVSVYFLLLFLWVQKYYYWYISFVFLLKLVLINSISFSVLILLKYLLIQNIVYYMAAFIFALLIYLYLAKVFNLLDLSKK